MLPRASPQCWSDSQEGQNKPDNDFFDSDNFQLLVLTRQRGEETCRKAVLKARRERRRRQALIDRSTSQEIGFYSQLFRADGNRKPRKPGAPPQTFFGLRRPLNKHEQRVVAALPCWEKSFQEWADKPFSTVFHGYNAYDGHFPLLMQVNSESEDKGVTVIQTETRRKSMVITNYADATIKLEGDDQAVCYAVFPILHVVIESAESSESSDAYSSTNSNGSSDETSTPRNRPPPLLPQDVLDRLTAIAAQSQSNDGNNDDDESDESDVGPPKGWLERQQQRTQGERRLSITTRPCAEKPRMLKRRSLDYGSLFYHHEVESMDAIAEDGDEENSPSPSGGGSVSHSPLSIVKGSREGTWAMETKAKLRESKDRDLSDIIRRAEREMELMDTNLHKLEKFLEEADSDDSD
ncbi:uncharacterized protein [Diadema antillarum]|uniref:uncharacterized protein n=1 Tax=Diadema antillarum TaxID=105358 RepID=UPI003A8B17C5